MRTAEHGGRYRPWIDSARAQTIGGYTRVPWGKRSQLEELPPTLRTMFRWLRSQLQDRGYLLPAMPERDDAFVALVREYFDPVCNRHGLDFNAASVGMDTGSVRLQTQGDRPPPVVRETTVLYEASAQVFSRAYPGVDTVSPEDHCVDLWVCLDADRGTIRVELDGADPLKRLRALDPRTAERLDAHGDEPAEILAARAEALDRYLQRSRA